MENSTAIPKNFNYNFKRNPKVKPILNNFFEIEFQFAKNANANQIKSSSLFFNFVQKFGTFQGEIFDSWCEYIRHNEFTKVD